jgi:hypothetical protein
MFWRRGMLTEAEQLPAGYATAHFLKDVKVYHRRFLANSNAVRASELQLFRDRR